jgi:hypothetical protein
MRAVNVLQQMDKLVVRDGFLIFLKNMPPGMPTERADIRCQGTGPAPEAAAEKSSQNNLPPPPNETIHPLLDSRLFNIMLVKC